ncbi:MAG: FAD-dependent oxidoreductase, partial [Sedimentisphaerales bacterium]|nr:FAD-dependent oxidoreductase [Sedimentisphaerales bacterium]
YRVWVRTRDWVATWNAPGTPGKFQVLLDSKPLETVFGTEDAHWHWQDGGTVTVACDEVTLALHDLTGFEGRCDAVVFTEDTNLMPPNRGEEMAAFRRKTLGLPDRPQDAERFDLVVVGGGMAGTCTAISAARLGLQVALVQDRPVLGGNNSSEIRVHLNGEINLPPYPRLGDVVRELDSGKRGNAQPADSYGDDRKLRIARAEPNIHLFLDTRAYQVEMAGHRIVAVLGKNIRTSQELRLAAPLFADCTGDGTIGFLAGADYRMGRESRAETGESMAPEEPDKMTMGASAQWYSVQADGPSPFPECPWALPFTEESCQHVTRGDWDWESGLNDDQVTEFEQIRDHIFRAVYGNWAFQKNHSQDKARYANLKLGWVAYIAGKRESRRLLGDIILRQQDIQEHREYPDAFVTTTWSIDLHYPAPANSKHFPGQEFRTIAKQPDIKPYPIPYRCFYCRNIENLFMAGRDISVTHVALGTVRVMRTGGMMGELVGMAATLCRQHATTPRGVYEDHLDELKHLAQRGVGKDALTQ